MPDTKNYFQFNVDDMLFFKAVDIPEILRILSKEQHDKVFCAHLKLYPGITYSHTTDKMIALVPKFTKVEESKFLKYDRNETELDWNYPFDFCGSIYELEIVVKVMESIED